MDREIKITEKIDNIVKDNCLIEACYKLEKNEKRLILFCISKFDRYSELIKDTFEITAKEFAEAFDMDESNAYSYLKEGVLELYNRSITKIENRGVSMFRWVDKIHYSNHEGKVVIRLGRSVLPYLINISENFTKYALADIGKMKSIYSIRIYEFIMQFKNEGWFHITIEELKQRLGLENEYKLFKAFNRKVIKVAVDEINKSTNINLEFTLIKKGRIVKAIKFTFNKKERKTKKYFPKKPEKNINQNVDNQSTSFNKKITKIIATPMPTDLKEKIKNIGKI